MSPHGAMMPSILDDLFDALYVPNKRTCTMCRVRCPTDKGQPLPDGWTTEWSVIVRDQLYCPTCSKWVHHWDVMGG